MLLFCYQVTMLCHNSLTSPWLPGKERVVLYIAHSELLCGSILNYCVWSSDELSTHDLTIPPPVSDAPLITVPGRVHPVEVRYCPTHESATDKPTADKINPQPYLIILQVIDQK